MAEETITILKVGTEEAVKSVNDLKENIKQLKTNLGELEIGTEEYQNTLEELKVNQNALKDAMYATTTSMEDVAAAATGASKSYNSLVHQMAALKEEWRATNDEARRNELGEQIANINQQLKDMDASVGNFSRNVGNYESGTSKLVEKFDQFGGILKQMPPTLGAAKESIGKVGETMQLVGKQPILGIIGLLAPIIMKITDALKENETAMDAVKKLMAAFQPVFDVLSGVIEGVAQGVAKVVDWFVELIGQSSGVENFISKVTGVGSAISKFMLTPIRTVIAAVSGLGKVMSDVFTGKFSQVKEDAKSAMQGIQDAIKEGISFEQNFENGKEFGTKFIDGIKTKTEDAKIAGKETATAFQEGYDEELERIKAEIAEDAEAEAAHAEEEAFNEEMARQEEWEKQKTDALVQSALDRYQAKEDALQKEADLEKAVADETTQYIKNQAEQRKQNTITTLFALADATSSVLGSLADMYESDEKNAEKNAKKIKALRIAEATINTISGAIGAFMQATASMPPPFGAIVGAVQAAAITAAGIAQIAQMKSTSVESGSAGATSLSSSAATTSAATTSDIGATVDAPNIETGMQTVRSVTSASEEERLNRMASSQRVYILQSDLEASDRSSKVAVAESSF